MIRRFQGDENHHKVVEALQRQQITQNDKAVAEKLAAVAELVQVEPAPPNHVFITQEAPDNDLYLILAGKVSISVNGREVAIRQAGQHVGEMAMLDTSAPRCATVAAIQQTVMAKVTERDFTPIANKHPSLWRQLAIELGNRLRERGKHVKAPNPRPVIFLGSSAEKRHVAEEIRDGLSYEKILPKVWTDDLFRPSDTSIENLERELETVDFAALVVTPDDLVESRGSIRAVPRDNVIWEHAFFAGGLGRSRVFIVKPRGADLKLPSDLLGVTALEYDRDGTTEDLRARVGPVINGIRKAIERLGPK
jgi:predicted nucleotide-binding protein